jgi:hypothetical protein
MTFEKIDEVMTLDAEFLESWRADAARIANEDWRELAALLDADFSKDVLDLLFSGNFAETQ